MFKARSVPFLMIAALVTGVVELVGLHRLEQIWNARAVETTCPAPFVAVVPAPAPAPPEVASRQPEIGFVSMRRDLVEIDVDGRRLELPGYPAPRSESHDGRLTTVVFTADREQVAVAGDCHGGEGEKPPSCAPSFVRLYRVADGAHVRDLKTPWRPGEEYEHRVRAMAFDERGERLAVLLTASWADCMWEGEYVRLLVYRLADGKRLAKRDLASHDTTEAHTLSFHDDEVKAGWRGDGHPKSQAVRL